MFLRIHSDRSISHDLQDDVNFETTSEKEIVKEEPHEEENSVQSHMVGKPEHGSGEHSSKSHPHYQGQEG